MSRRLACIVASCLALGACSSSSEPAATPGTTAVVDNGTVETIDVEAEVDGERTAVSYLQEALTDLGHYTGPLDGVPDDDLRAAIASFQKANAIEPSARFDAPTAFALARTSPELASLAIAGLQTMLVELGYFTGTIDGRLDSAGMTDAIRALQRDADLTADGIFGPKSFAALERLYHDRVGVFIDPPDDTTTTSTTVPAASTTTSSTTAATTTSTPTTSTAPVSTTTPPATTTTTVIAPTTTRPVAPTTTVAGGDATQRKVQERLTALGYRPGPVDGKPGAQTSSAVLAFQKREGLERTGKADAATVARLSAPKGKGPRTMARGPRVEIDLDRQILFFVDAAGAVTTINTSTGSGRPYKNASGTTVIAYTPTGNFSVQRRIDGIRKAPLGSLYRPMYFTGGWAIHGSPVVPAWPASHGCARTANWDQDYLFPKLPNGAPVVVYGTPKGSPSKGEPGF